MKGKHIVAAAFCLFALLAKADDSLFEAGPMVIPAGEDLDASEMIDKLVCERLSELNLEPAKLCSDEVFLRRIYLVMIGTLPREDEVRDFLSANDEFKRELMVDRLIDRPEFADYWSMKWGDILRIKAEFPIKLWPNAVQSYHHWVHDSVRTNKPYDVFVRELLTGSGSNFRQGEVNFYRAMQDRSPRGMASTVALTVMGERTKHWPERKLDAMAGFFSNVAFKSTSEWKEEIVFFNPTSDEEELHKQAIFPDGTAVDLDPSQRDPRVVFADWLIRPENPYFSKTISNRIWSWLMGQGIVHEPDDFGPHNPPANPKLLAHLESEFKKSHCDIKQLFRIILKSQTFQLSSIPAQVSPEATANFAHYPLRRVEAEVLIDALNQITETKEDYSSPIPEPFTFIPDNIRAIALADGSITSSFLELYGRPPRDTGLEVERSRNVTAAQRLHLLNSSHVQKKIKVCPLVTKTANVSAAEQPEMIERIYIQVLSRYPTAKELELTSGYSETMNSSSKELAADLVWSLINQPEFYFIH